MDKEIKLIVIILLIGVTILAGMGIVFVMGTEPQPATVTKDIPREDLTIR